jgi:hypothetical protein
MQAENQPQVLGGPVAVAAQITAGMHAGVSLNGLTQTCASSRRSPPGDLVLHLSIARQRAVGLQIIEVIMIKAREEIPQP